MASEALVSLRNVSHYFGAGALRTQALCGVTADIWPGELVMVMGPSGSGKTTLLNLIGGLRRVAEGTLRVLDEEPRSAPESTMHRLRRRIGFIFQHHHLLNSLIVRRNVEMGASGVSARVARGLAEAMLEEVGLEGLGHAHLKQLPGGQRQRVAIARALIRNPPPPPCRRADGVTGRDHRPGNHGNAAAASARPELCGRHRDP